MTPDDVRRLALALPETCESAHFGRPDFRVRGKVFATLWPNDKMAVVKLDPGEQQLRIEADPHVFAPVPGGWGQRGWTILDLGASDEATLRSALLAAWTSVAPKRLVLESARSAPGRIDQKPR